MVSTALSQARACGASNMPNWFGPYPYHPFDGPTEPPPSEDEGGFCLTVDRKWLPYLLACAYALTAEQTWATDGDRAIKQAQDIILALETGIICPDINPVIDGGECGDCMGCCIRVENGVIQTLDCGVWKDVPGGNIKEIAGGTSPQPEPDGVPAAGSCNEFDLVLTANSQVLLPMAISTGDTVEITTWNGAWSDGSGVSPYLFYFCADGQRVALGTCAGGEYNDPSDPMPAALHMSIIAGVGGVGTYIAPMGAAKSIPPGVTDEQLVFRANDLVPGDNVGSVSFHVKVCRPSAAAVLINYGSPENGSGPSSAELNSTFVVDSQLVGLSGQYGIHIVLNGCHTLHIMALTSYTDPGGISRAWDNPCTGSLAGLGGPAAVGDNYGPITELVIDSATQYRVTFKIT